MDGRGRSRSPRGLGVQAAAEIMEYRQAFRAFDTDGSGSIDLNELSNALQRVQQDIEARAPTAGWVAPRPFNLTTCCWLAGRFAVGGVGLNEGQFCECMAFVKNLRGVFAQVDTDGSGAISVGELHAAFAQEGVQLDAGTVNQIGQSFDFDKNGQLEFDEFVQMRLEWDTYFSAWQQTTGGSSHMAPQQLLVVLEDIKRSLDPVGVALRANPGLSMMSLHGLVFSGGTSRPFQPQTCETLIIRFGGGNLFINFAQFAAMMVFVKEMKTTFSSMDANGDGSLDVDELTRAFAGAGMNLPQALVQSIHQNWFEGKQANIEFDQFVQIAAEWHEVFAFQNHAVFGGAGMDTGVRITATDLQTLLGNVRVIYRIINQAVQGVRSYSLNTCRWLVAKFGTPIPGETYAQGVTWNEILNLMQYLKQCGRLFTAADASGVGTMGVANLAMLMRNQGLNLSPQAIEMVCRSADMDMSGTIEFDEFLQVSMECETYNRCFDARVAQPGLLTPMNTLNPMLGAVFGGASAGLAGQEVITLDRSAFFAMVFGVPRGLG